MPTINHAFREIVCKIVYYGPGLGGKTTNLQFVHTNVPQKHRGDLVSLATEQDRTLFFDYLPLDIGDVKGYKTKFQLYTVPGQVFYNATRKLVLRGADGIAFIADSQAGRREANVESLKNLTDNLREYDMDLDTVPLVMQYNKRDLPDALPLETIRGDLNPEGKYPEFEAVATEGVGVRETLRQISSQILKRLNETANIISDEKLVGERLGVLPIAGTEQDESANNRSSQRGGPDLEIRQRSQVRWMGFGVGSGTMMLETVRDETGNAEYHFASEHSVLGMKRKVTRVLSYVGEDRRTTDGRERLFHVLRDLNSSREMAPLNAYLEKAGDPRLYAVYPGIIGEINISPVGDSTRL